MRLLTNVVHRQPYRRVRCQEDEAEDPWIGRHDDDHQSDGVPHDTPPFHCGV